MTSKTPQSVWKNWIHFLAFGFGVGTLPMPKTWACLVSVVLYLFLSKLPHFIYALLLLILLFIAVWLCEVTSKQLKLKNHHGIVIDQIAGMLIALFAVPITWKWLLLTFVLFRLLSIIKLWPIRWIQQNVEGGLSLVLDDVVVAFYTLIIVQVLLWAMGLAPL